MSSNSLRRLAALCGIVGPLLFACVVVALSIIKYPYLHALGWDPLRHPTHLWPSGLSLGSGGWIMTVTFLLCGLLMAGFALGLRTQMRDRAGRLAALLLAAAGLAMMGLAFTTDPTELPATWHGALHDLSFLLLGLFITPALVLFGLSFRRSNPWKGLSLFAWVTALLAIPTFAVKGPVFYAFLAAVLAWSVLAAVRLYRQI